MIFSIIAYQDKKGQSKSDIMWLSKENMRNVTDDDIMHFSKIIKHNIVISPFHYNNGTRHLDNVQPEIDMLMYDIDEHNLSINEIEEILSPFEAIVQETWSSTPDDKKYRLYFPFDGKMSIDKRFFQRFTRLVAKHLNLNRYIDTNTNDMARGYIQRKDKPVHIINKDGKRLPVKGLQTIYNQAIKEVVYEESQKAFRDLERKEKKQQNGTASLYRYQMPQDYQRLRSNSYIKECLQEAQPGHRNKPAFKIVSFCKNILDIPEMTVLAFMKLCSEFQGSDYVKQKVVHQMYEGA
jgi:hypothetical protein